MVSSLFLKQEKDVKKEINLIVTGNSDYCALAPAFFV
jgi:hypothetical protein